MRAPTISLLHATYRAGDAAVDLKARWLGEADAPSLVEHVFSMDADDDVSIRATEGHHRIVNPPVSGSVTAVRNWNAAAACATGDLMVVIADDLFPPPSWDATLREIVGDLDPVRFAFAVKVSDGAPGRERRPMLIRHPILSRRLYERSGLFDPRFRGLFCDDDFTVRAFRDAVVIDGTRLALEHRHPSVDAAMRTEADCPGPAGDPRPPTESQRKLGSPEELRFGVEQFRAKWSGAGRSDQAFFSPRPGTSAPTAAAWVWRRRLWAGASARRGRRRVSARVRRILPG